MPCINKATVPETRGAAMLVPPKSEKDSCFESFFIFVIDDGVKLYAPILIKSGFGSPIIPGPLLEKSTISLKLSVVLPNLGCPLNCPYRMKQRLANQVFHNHVQSFQHLLRL